MRFCFYVHRGFAYYIADIFSDSGVIPLDT